METCFEVFLKTFCSHFAMCSPFYREHARNPKWLQMCIDKNQCLLRWRKGSDWRLPAAKSYHEHLELLNSLLAFFFLIFTPISWGNSNEIFTKMKIEFQNVRCNMTQQKVVELGLNPMSSLLQGLALLLTREDWSYRTSRLSTICKHLISERKEWYLS